MRWLLSAAVSLLMTTAMANTGLLMPSALAYSVWPSRHVVFDSNCAELDRAESALDFHKGLIEVLNAPRSKARLSCLHQVVLRFPYVAAYMLDHQVVLLAHQSRPIPWPHNRHLFAGFIAKRDMLKAFYPQQDVYWRHLSLWLWRDLGRNIPFILLYRDAPRQIKAVLMPPHQVGRVAMQLAEAVLQHRSPAMLTASIHVLEQQHLQPSLRVYALGLAMLANCRMHQYRSALLLFDVYAKSLMQQHGLPLDLVWLRAFAQQQITQR